MTGCNASSTWARQDAMLTAMSAQSALMQPINGYNVQVAFARTADTTAYTALDVIGIDAAGSAGNAIQTFALIGPSAGGIIITGADLMYEAASIPSGMTNLVLHLFDTSPTAILDNAAFVLGATDTGKYLGNINLGAPAVVGQVLFTEANGLGKEVKLAVASTSIYGIIQTVGGFTPASGTLIKVRLHTVPI